MSLKVGDTVLANVKHYPTHPYNGHTGTVEEITDTSVLVRWDLPYPVQNSDGRSYMDKQHATLIDPVTAAVRLLESKGYKVKKPEFGSKTVSLIDRYGNGYRVKYAQTYIDYVAIGGTLMSFEEFDKVAAHVKEAREFTKNHG